MFSSRVEQTNRELAAQSRGKQLSGSMSSGASTPARASQETGARRKWEVVSPSWSLWPGGGRRHARTAALGMARAIPVHGGRGGARDRQGPQRARSSGGRLPGPSQPEMASPPADARRVLPSVAPTRCLLLLLLCAGVRLAPPARGKPAPRSSCADSASGPTTLTFTRLGPRLLHVRTERIVADLPGEWTRREGRERGVQR